MNVSDANLELAKERTLMAAERTFSAWMRTGLAGIAAGLGVARLLSVRSAGHEFATVAAGALLIASAVAIMLFALWSYGRTVRTLQVTGDVAHSLWLYVALTVVLVVVAVLALYIVV